MVRVMTEPAVWNVVYGNDTRARVGEFVHAPRPPFQAVPGRVFKARVKRVLDVILGGSSKQRAWSRNFLESSSGRRY
jgi:hypothetical protein